MGEAEGASAAIREGGSSPRLRLAGMVLGPALALAILLAPIPGLDSLQRRAAAVTALVATFWLTQAIPLGAASLLPAALLPLLGVLPAGLAAASYMHDLVLLFLGAFVVAGGLERWGVHRRMALAVVASVGTRPRRLVLGFTAATALVSMWINNTAAALMMYPIALAVIGAVGAPRVGAGLERGRRDPFAIAVLLGVAYGASLGGMATPVGTAPNQILLGTLRERFPDAPAIGFGQWTLAWLPFVAAFVITTWLVLTRVALRVGTGDVVSADVVKSERARLGRMSRGERMMAAVFAVTALLWVTREDLALGAWTLPGWSSSLANLQAVGVAGASVAEFSDHVTDATVAIAVACLCFALPVEPKRGIFLMDWETAAKLPWDVLLLFGGGFCLAAGIEASGLDLVLGGALKPLFGTVPTWVAIAALVLVVTLLSEIASNTVITNLILPVLAKAAVAAGIHPLALMAPATMAASCGFMLPVATPPNAIVFSSRRIPPGTMARVGLAVDLIGVVLIPLAFELWAGPLLGVTDGLPIWARP